MDNAALYMQKITELNQFLDNLGEEVEIYVNNTFISSSSFKDLLTGKKLILTGNKNDFLGKFRGQDVFLLDADSGKPELFIIPIKHKDQFRSD